ncbi:MAG: Fic family protein, partial [Candidatus Roizmanbacteria bacterium]|nr:Fic family protein [Candidatus Roizmanbacteria bacterium]
GELAELRKWYITTNTYHSNAIEGNSLTLEETRIVVEDGLTVKGKPLKDVLEAKNHKEAMNVLFDIVKQKNDISEEVALQLHKQLLESIHQEDAGVYRRVQVQITGDTQLPPPAHDVPELMAKLYAWYSKEKESVHPIVLAAEFHYRLVKIHPFIDGNGRIARLLTNLILLKNGYPLVIVPTVLRQDYISSLKSTSPKSAFIEFFLQTTKENMQDYLRMIADSGTI